MSLLQVQTTRSQRIQAFYGRNPSWPVISPIAQVEVPVCESSAIEVLLPNGTRIGTRHAGRPQEPIALIRGVAGYVATQPC